MNGRYKVVESEGVPITGLASDACLERNRSDRDVRELNLQMIQ